MDMVIRRGQQAAIDFHALIVGEAALAPMELPEAHVRDIARDMAETLQAQVETICTKSEALGVLEYLKGQMLAVQFQEGPRTITVPLAFDKYDNGSLLASGQQVMGFPVHRLESVTVGYGRARKFTFSSPKGPKVSSITMTPSGGSLAPNPAATAQKRLLDGYTVAQSKLTSGYRVHVQGEGMPMIGEVLQPLKGQVIAAEWMGAPTADPVWRGITGWISVESVEGDASSVRVGGTGWSIDVRSLVGWRVGTTGIVLDALGSDGSAVPAVNLKLIR